MWEQNIGSTGGQYTSVPVIDNQTLPNVIYDRMNVQNRSKSKLWWECLAAELKLNFSTLDSLLVSPTTVSAPRTATLLRDAFRTAGGSLCTHQPHQAILLLPGSLPKSVSIKFTINSCITDSNTDYFFTPNSQSHQINSSLLSQIKPELLYAVAL